MAVDQGSPGHLVHVEVASLGDHVEQAVLVGCLHEHGEVAGCIWGELDLGHRFELLLTGGRGADLSADDAMSLLSSLPLTEAEKLSVAGAWHISDGHLSEASRVTLQRHGHGALDRVELDVGEDVAVSIGVKTDQVAPLLAGVHIVRHDLAVGHLGQALEDLDGSGRGTLGDIEVIHVGSADEGQLGVADPAPEHDLLVELGSDQFLSGAQIKDL